MITIKTKSDLQELFEEAKKSPRLRKNLNLHQESDTVQRFFNALIPNTYIRPHRHLSPPKTETMILIEGKMVVVLFNEEGCLIKKIELSKNGPNIALDLSPEIWHSVYALEPTIFFECKLGPYIPLSDKDFALWAPAEGSSESNTFLQQIIKELPY